MKNFLRDLTEKKAVVVGAGVSGASAARLLHDRGARVLVMDKKEQAIDKLRQETAGQHWEFKSGQHSVDDFAGADLIVLSPGIRRDIFSLLPPGIPVTSELELAAAFVQEPVIAVTGTNGKTTTVSMISHILSFCGKTVFTGGNIGVPLSEYVLSEKKRDLLVLEVSSFQLQDLAFFRPNVGILLNFSPNHLDYHKDIQEYFKAKMNLFRYMREGDLAIFPEQLREQVASQIPSNCSRKFYLPLASLPGARLAGEHNKKNAGAACLAVEYFGLKKEEAVSALASFVPAHHRYEQFFETAGIRFINDSKATTLTALEAALSSSSAPVRLLAGGVFKGGDPASLRDLIKSKVAGIYLFGASREIFSSAWQDLCPLVWHQSLSEAVDAVCADAVSGDTVLLAPATSSFDLFQNYQERGDEFKRLVKKKYTL